MNWLNSMIIDLQNKFWTEDQQPAESLSAFGIKNEKEATQKLHQFKNRLQDLDRRIMELR